MRTLGVNPSCSYSTHTYQRPLCAQRLEYTKNERKHRTLGNAEDQKNNLVIATCKCLVAGPISALGTHQKKKLTLPLVSSDIFLEEFSVIRQEDLI